MLFDRHPELAIAVGLEVRECLHHLPDVLVRPGHRRDPAQTEAGRQRTPEQHLGLPSVTYSQIINNVVPPTNLPTKPDHPGGISIEAGGTVCLLVNHLCPGSSLQSDVGPIKY